MYRLTEIRDIKRLAAKYEFFFKKGFGQNFLTNERVLQDIVSAAGVDSHSSVLEIGPGFGVLTQKLCENAGRVICLEIDQRLLPVLKETLAEFQNYEIVLEDVMKCDLGRLLDDRQIGGKITVAANLPYYISTPVLMKLLENKGRISRIVVMLQKEVAERIVAKSGTKEYGALSVAVQYACDAKIVSVVGREDFVPAPKVDSAVVCMDVLEQPRIQDVSEQQFFKVVRAAFSQRRKTLKNALSNSGLFQMSKEELGILIASVCGDETVRGERLTLEMFGEIAQKIF